MIGAIGGAAADIVQAIRDARAERSTSQTKASATPDTPAATGTGPAAGAPPSDPVAKLLADVKSLLLGVQSGTSPGPSSGTSAAGDGSTDPAAAVQNDLASLASAGTAGKAGHHHHHRAPVGGAGPDPSATTASAGTAGQDPGLVSAIAKAISAYRTNGAATAATTATASA